MNQRPLLSRLPEILFGGDYNPEQWPEEVWAEDMRLMREAGVNLVSIGIFAWSKLQPSEDRYDFEWLDRLMGLLAENGIYADLATATATPPPWMSRYPDLAAVDADGRSYSHGSRQHYSPASPTYRRFAAALVHKLAKRYAGHPALALWHINNEYACHVAECHSEAATKAFRVWLKRRYGDLEGLNAAWNAPFWSQIYHDWEEVLTPRRVPTFGNPTQVLDFRRFSHESILGLCRMEAEILRKVTPEIPVTTNLMGVFKPLDYWEWAEAIDFVSWDTYPDFLPGEDPRQAAAEGHDLMRSLKPDRPFVLMEHVTSHVHWRPINPTKRPGMIRLYGMQTVARGGEGVMFFQWRQSLAGAEKFHGSIIQHGVPPGEGRVFREVCELGGALKKLQPVMGSSLRAEVAIVMDWANWWALEESGKPRSFDYAATLSAFHRYFHTRNLAVDFVPPTGDLSRFQLVVAPLLYLLGTDGAENLCGYVRSGGRLLSSYFSGIVDSRDHVIPGGYPARLRDCLGLWVEEWYALGPGERASVALTGSGEILPAVDWTEVIHLESAEVLASFREGPLAGRAALARNTFGQGSACYLGAAFEATELAKILDLVCADLPLRSPIDVPPGVEVTVREAEGRRFLFLLNHTEKGVEIPLGGYAGRELLSESQLSSVCSLAPFGVAVIESLRQLPA